MPAADDHARRARGRDCRPRRGARDRRRVHRLSSRDVDLVVAAFIAGQQVPLTEEQRNAAVRRALFVFAAGGDLHRDPTLDDPAVAELAADLDSPERREALLAASEELAALNDPDLAWRAYACGLLADALGEDEDT